MSKCYHRRWITPRRKTRCAAWTPESPAKLISCATMMPIPTQPPEVNKTVKQFTVNLKPFRFSQVEIQHDSPHKNKQSRGWGMVGEEKVFHNNLSNVTADRVSPKT